VIAMSYELDVSRGAGPLYCCLGPIDGVWCGYPLV